MESENLDMESINKERRHAVAESIHEIDIVELKILEERLFPDVTHPWLEPFHRFVEENRGNIFYHASSTDGFEVVYCRAKEKGIWFIPGMGLAFFNPVG